MDDWSKYQEQQQLSYISGEFNFIKWFERICFLYCLWVFLKIEQLKTNQMGFNKTVEYSKRSENSVEIKHFTIKSPE